MVQTGVVTRVVAFGGDDDDVGEQEEGQQKLLRAQQSSSSSLLDDAIDACPVPMDQRPSSQLKEVAEGIVSGWGGLDGKSYALRLTILCGFFSRSLRTRSRARRIIPRFSGPRRTSRRCWVR